jgi:hypothetical protein
LLKTSQALYSKDLSDEETKFWIGFLEPMTVQSLRYAFDNWNRNGRWFPKPKDIADLVETYKLSLKKTDLPPGCEKCHEGWIKVYEGKTAGGNEVSSKVGGAIRCECVMNPALRRRPPHYGQGYGTADIEYLLKRYLAKQQSIGNRSLTEGEVNLLLDDLDQKRGWSPEWRHP